MPNYTISATADIEIKLKIQADSEEQAESVAEQVIAEAIILGDCKTEDILNVDINNITREND